jgi:Glycosyl transferases group 1
MTRNSKNPKLIWLSYYHKDYSRSGAIRNLLPKELQGDYYRIRSGFWHALQSLRKILKNHSDSIVVVMSPCHLIVLLVKILKPSQKVILDAGWTLSEAQIARNQKRNFEFQFNLLIDHLSFRLANYVFVESLQQLNFCRKKFQIKERKINVIHSVLNYSLFEDSKAKSPREILKRDGRKILFFRGTFTIEAGLDQVLKIAKNLEFSACYLVVIATNRNFQDIFSNVPQPNNLIWINRWLDYDELIWLYRNCYAVFGQMNTTSRTKNTLPHKLFEASYFAKPYITPDHEPIQTFFDSPNCYLSVSQFPKLGKDLIFNLDNDIELSRIGIRSHRKYEEKCGSKAVSQVFELAINTLLLSK